MAALLATDAVKSWSVRLRAARVSLAFASMCVGCLDRAPSRESREDVPEHTVVHRRHHGGGDTDDNVAARPTRRVYAKNRFVWIRRSPDEASDWIGYITLGESVRVREGASRAKDDTGCPSWVGVEPEGWVCVGKNATLDPADDVVVHLAEHAADRSSPWPYDYARSLGAARYRGLPTERDEHAREGDVDLLRKRIDQARLVGTDDAAIRAIDPRLVGAELGMTSKPPPTLFAPPPGVLETDEDVGLGSTIAYSYEFDYHGRAFLLSWDHGVIPEARVKKYPRSPFHGVALGTGVELPLAFTKKNPPHKVVRGADGALVESKETFAAQSPIALTKDPPVSDSSGRAYRATREPGVFVAERDVVLVTPLGEPPKLAPGGRRTWVEVSTVGGYLVAYEGDEPVYATLISAGRARMLDDKTMAPVSSTPNGTYAILSKLETTSMRPEPKGAFAVEGATSQSGTVHAEVMYTQVFHEGFALHGAYWHDDWGDRKSAGCVNLAPTDAKWLFDWSEPAVPIDWHARRTMPGDPVTRVVVHP